MTVSLVSDANNRFTKDRADTTKMNVPEVEIGAEVGAVVSEVGAVGSEVGEVGSKVGAVGLGVGSGVADH